MASEASSAVARRIGLKAPAVVPFRRAISWTIAMGEVGSFAISSARYDTGWVHAKPARATAAPAVPIRNTTRSASTGAARSLDSRAVTTRASGTRSAARIGYVKNLMPPWT